MTVPYSRVKVPMKSYLFGKHLLRLCLSFPVLAVAVHGLGHNFCRSADPCPDVCDKCSSTTPEEPAPASNLDQLKCDSVPGQESQCCRVIKEAPWWASLQTLHPHGSEINHSTSAAVPALGPVPPSSNAPPLTPPISPLVSLPPKLNVLMFIVDDMRPDLKAFGHKDAPPTPHLDAFAATARVFRRAYSQVLNLLILH